MPGPGSADSRTLRCRRGWRQEISLIVRRFKVGCLKTNRDGGGRARTMATPALPRGRRPGWAPVPPALLSARRNAHPDVCCPSPPLAPPRGLCRLSPPAAGPRIALTAVCVVSAMAGGLQAGPCSLRVPGWAGGRVWSTAVLHQGREEAGSGSFPRAGRRSGCSGGMEPCSAEQGCRRPGGRAARSVDWRGALHPAPRLRVSLAPRSGAAAAPCPHLPATLQAAGHHQGG